MLSSFKCPKIQQQYQEESPATLLAQHPPCLFSTTTSENLVLSNVFLCLCIWNWTQPTKHYWLKHSLCYHITFNSTLLQPKPAFTFDPLYQMFSLSYPQWDLISWVTKNYFQLKLLFPLHMQYLMWCCIIVLCSWVWSVWLVSYTVFSLN